MFISNSAYSGNMTTAECQVNSIVTGIILITPQKKYEGGSVKPGMLPIFVDIFLYAL